MHWLEWRTVYALKAWSCLHLFSNVKSKEGNQHKNHIRHYSRDIIYILTVYPKKHAHCLCFAVLCCGCTLTDFPISIRLTSLALWQSNDCPSASKATPMNMDKYFMWIHYERLHNHNKAKHNKTVCIFLGIYCTWFNGPINGDNTVNLHTSTPGLTLSMYLLLITSQSITQHVTIVTQIRGKFTIDLVGILHLLLMHYQFMMCEGTM